MQDGVEQNFARQYQEFEDGKFSESATQFISSSWQGEALRSSQVYIKMPLVLLKTSNIACPISVDIYIHLLTKSGLNCLHHLQFYSILILYPCLVRAQEPLNCSLLPLLAQFSVVSVKDVDRSSGRCRNRKSPISKSPQACPWRH